jgi:DNA-binding PadR family transcriptional regulator
MDTPDKSRSQDRVLTTTSYAVLCVLALRDHAMYDLIQQMHKSMHYMWPRAESNVYAEPKRLVSAGLATGREEWNGGRRRTIYSITPAGRAELRRWFANPSSHQRYENEALVKVLFAQNASLDDALAAVRSIARDAEQTIAHFLAVADDYAAGTGEYPRRFAISAVAGRLLLEQQTATVRWAAWAEQTLLDWGRTDVDDADWGVGAMRERQDARQIVEPRGKPSRSAVSVSRARSTSSSK